MNPFGMSKSARFFPYLGLLPATLLYVLFSVGPSLATAVFSFTDISGVIGTPWHFVGFENYHELYLTATNPFNMNGLGKVIRNTVIFSLVITVFQNTFALITALLLNARPKGHIVYRSIIFLPVILGVTVSGLVWTLFFSPIDGPAQRIFHEFGWSSAFFGSDRLAFPLVMFVQIWMYMGFSVLIFLAGLQTIQRDLYEAADIDGARSWNKFWKVTFPLIAPTVTTNMLLAIIGSLQTFDTIFVLTKGQFDTMTLGMLVYNTGFGSDARMGYASSISMVMFIIVLLITLGSQYYLRRRETEL